MLWISVNSAMEVGEGDHYRLEDSDVNLVDTITIIEKKLLWLTLQ